MTESELQDLVPDLAEISTAAGQRILEIYHSDFDVDTKTDGTPLTRADRLSNELIQSRLSRLTPGIPVMSEESEIPSYAERKMWQQYWLVDFLDGTKEFVKRSGEFTTNIALVVDNRSALGIVHTPDKGWMHWGWKNGGADVTLSSLPSRLRQP